MNLFDSGNHLELICLGDGLKFPIHCSIKSIPHNVIDCRTCPKSARAGRAATQRKNQHVHLDFQDRTVVSAQPGVFLSAPVPVPSSASNRNRKVLIIVIKHD